MNKMSTLRTNSFTRGGKNYTDFKPSRNGRVKPNIMETLTDEEGKPEYYMCDDNKMYTVKGYHDNFDVVAKVKVLSRKQATKASNPNRKAVALQ